jgi:hypothetical protein
MPKIGQKKKSEKKSTLTWVEKSVQLRTDSLRRYVTVPAYVCVRECVAIHLSTSDPKKWTVTHTSTGLAIITLTDEDEARKFAEVFVSQTDILKTLSIKDVEGEGGEQLNVKQRNRIKRKLPDKVRRWRDACRDSELCLDISIF